MSLLLFLFILAILFVVCGILIFAFVVYYVLCLGILALIQLITVGAVNKVTGKKFELALSPVSFGIETIILIALVAVYTSLPARPVTLDAEDCSYVCYQYNSSEYQEGEPALTHEESIEEMVGRLKELKVSRTLPTTIRYGYPNARTGSKFSYLYFLMKKGAFCSQFAFMITC